MRATANSQSPLKIQWAKNKGQDRECVSLMRASGRAKAQKRDHVLATMHMREIIMQLCSRSRQSFSRIRKRWHWNYSFDFTERKGSILPVLVDIPDNKKLHTMHPRKSIIKFKFIGRQKSISVLQWQVGREINAIDTSFRSMIDL